MAYKANSTEMEERRALLLETAFRLFAEHSIEAVNMTEIAEAAHVGMATVYRYFGVKQKLVVELGAMKWRDFAEEVEALFRAANGDKMTALQELAFYLDCYIELYQRHPALLRFNANFDQYIRHAHIPAEELRGYYDSVEHFARKFSKLYAKNGSDHTLRSDITEQELFLSGMYTMLATAQKFAGGLIYPPESASFNCKRALELQKRMFLAYVKA